LKQYNDENLRYKQLVYKVFSLDEDGRELLDLWTKIYLFSPTIADGKNDWLPLVREGENRVIRSIHSDIKFIERMMEETASNEHSSINYSLYD